MAGNENWMTGLNDYIYISQMSLPGAHDAATQNLSIGKCQDKDIAGLWDAGVRVFDLRPTDSGDDCTINHGTLATNTTLRAALTTITGRLSTYGSEFAIVLMRKEDGGDSWASKVAAVINSFSDYVIPFRTNLRLGDVRGKVIILSRDEFASGYTISYWGDNTSRDVKSANGIDFVVQDYYKVEDTSAKSTAITDLLAEARKNTSSNRMFINHTSGYVPGLIPGLSDDITGNANTCNTLALNTIDANPGPTGIILMDYAGSSSYNGATLCNKIIEQNSNISVSAPSEPVTGQYYVYNVEREMYITRSNNYATRGGFDKAGMVIAVNNAGDGTLTLVTDVNGNGKGIFIADGNGETVYVDNAPTVWTFECIDNAKKIYTLKNGDKYLQAKDGQTRLEAGSLPSNKSAQWQFIPRNVREDLSVASASNPVDVTYLIENQGFDRYNGEQNSWKIADNSNWRPGDGWCRNADASNNCAEVWNANFDIHQSFTGLKDGVYELRVQGYYRMSEGNNSDYLISQMRAGNTNIQRTKYYINSTEAYLLPQLSATLPDECADISVDINGTTYRYPNGKGKASIAFREGYYENEPIQTIVTDGNLTIGMKLDNKNGEDWNCFDNFRLYYLGMPDISQFTDALEAAISAAQAYSGQTTTALQTALDAALAEAIAVRQSLDTDELTAKTNALNTARANAEAADVTFLAATIPFAQADGVDVTEANNVLANGTTAAQVNNALKSLRRARMLANAETAENIWQGHEPAEGDFYLYNVGQRRFLVGGSDWGAHAALGFPGQLITLVASGDNFFLDTHLPNNNAGRLNNRGYMDAGGDAFKFVKLGNGNYHIVQVSDNNKGLRWNPDANTDGGNNDENTVGTEETNLEGADAEWILVTIDDRNALAANASDTNPVDVSYLIQNPGFNQRAAIDKWTLTNTSIWGRGGNHPDFAIEAYDQASASVEQTVTGLPAGTYELKVQAFYRDGNFDTQANILANGGTVRQVATLYAGTKSALIQNVSVGADKVPGVGRSSEAGYMPDGIDDACRYFRNGLYWATLEEIVVGQDGTMTIGARKTERPNGGDWMVLDNFRLIYKGAGIDLSGVKADLLAKINEAATILNDLGLNLSFLATAKANGQNAYDNSTDADEIVDATNALQTAINQVNGASDMTVFKQTMTKATPEGIDVNVFKNAVESVIDGAEFAGAVTAQLNAVRTARRLNAVDKQPDIFTGSAPEDGGQYYIYNIGAQRYLTGGVNYGTHAALNFAAQIATFTKNGDGWRIHTNIRTNSDALNHNGYVDCGGDGDTWYLIEVSTGVYNISTINSNTGASLLGYSGERRGNWWQVDSDNSGADQAINQWKLVTKDERDALMANASESNPVDATYYIHAAGFDHWLADAQLAFPTQKWQTWFPEGKGGNNGIGGWEPDYNWEAWNAGNIKLYQELTGLVPGKYRVSAQAYYRHGNFEQAVSEFNNPKTDGAILYATNGKGVTAQTYIVPITSEVNEAPGYGRSSDVGSFPDDRNETAAQFFEVGLYKNVVEDVIVTEDGTLTIGIEKFENNQGSEWIVADNFRLTYLGPVEETIDVTITDAGYATLVAPFDATMPAGVTASTAEVNGQSIELTAISGAVPAHTPVILSADAAKSFQISGYPTAAPNELKAGALVGTYEDIQAPDGSYVLQKQDSKVGFFQVDYNYLTDNDMNKPKVRANRAYLIAPAANPVKAYLFEDAVDGIRTMDNGQWSMDNAEIFNVAGQRMNKLQRGVNIVNGKKVLVK